MFFKALLEHAPAKAKEICHPSRKDASEGKLLSSDATIPSIAVVARAPNSCMYVTTSLGCTNELPVRGVGGSDRDTAHDSPIVLQDIPEAGRVKSFKDKVCRPSFVANGSFL